MRTVPKSIHSPGRLEKYKECSGSANFGSRRKGQSSPMFPLLLRRRNAGSSSETTAEEEPTSPKVTCIGQVRVKSKHAGKGTENLRTFRKDVCDAIRSVGAEFSCIFPCNGGTPTSPHNEEEDVKHSSACGSALLAKFVMVLQDGDGKHHGRLDPDGRKQEKGLDSIKMGNPFGKMENPYDKNQERMRKSLRRFHDDDDEDDWMPAKSGVDCCTGFSHVDEDEDVEEPVCIPPKNALLLMRCRSAPLRLSLNSDCWMANSNADEPKNKGCVVESHGEDSTLASSGDEDEASNEEEGRETTRVKGSGETEKKSLPQGLLLMECEPELTKLSLEISKETWVPTREFFRRPMISQDGSRRLSKESSDQEECSKGGASNILDAELSPPEALMLKRCKSDPLKVSLKLAPEACLWKRRNLGKPLALNI
ncbi:hypothetical protein KI387_024289 [Taxus chinensis]|uniref:Uncharacterized protein n=1 Tax=Taxus chinensis TaxID=29808 RepID=A0AA38G3T7_TAXCH|nr:hypothetical protein KI387_024289 [Taxus chinensis]